MKILILNWRDVSHPKSGGAELVTMEHAKGWVRAGHRVTWLTASYHGAKPESVVGGVHFIRRWGSLTIYLYAPFYVLFNGRRYDVIVDEAHGFPFFTPLFTRTPVVIFIHEIAGEIWDFMFTFPKNLVGKLLERWYFILYRHCLFWTDAPSTVDELVTRGIPRNQCTAIPCPIVGEGHIRNKICKKENNPTYIFVSRAVRMKGIEEIVKAFSFIVRADPQSHLWIVGGGTENYVHEIQQMIDEYGVTGNITMFGEVTEKKKYELMSRAHLLLHASVKEGWGLVVLEAAYVGTPSVVYNVNGLKDVVKSGKTGIVLPDNSPREMAREAVRLYRDKRRYWEFQKNGKAWAAGLTWRDAVRSSLRVLKRAISHT